VEIKSAEAGWSSAVGLLAVYRLEPSEKKIHFAVMSVAIAKLASTNVIAFHDQPAVALFIGAHSFSCQRQDCERIHSNIENGPV
jgi:hypothetical protein